MNKTNGPDTSTHTTRRSRRTTGSYALTRKDAELAAEALATTAKLQELLARLALATPVPTALEEFSAGAQGTGAHRTPTPPAADDPRLKGRKVLMRRYPPHGGRMIRVVIERKPEGIYYWFDGEKWPSLSAISKHVSGGTRRGGFEFFGLGLPSDDRAER